MRKEISIQPRNHLMMNHTRNLKPASLTLADVKPSQYIKFLEFMDARVANIFLWHQH